MIECSKKRSSGYGTLEQDFAPDEYFGQRIRLTAWVKGLDAGTVMMFLRVDGHLGEVLAFDNTNNRAPHGTFDWRKQEIVLDVPNSAAVIQMGLILKDRGKAWLDDVTIEVVDKRVRTTALQRMPGPPNQRRAGMFVDRPPQNLDFEQ